MLAFQVLLVDPLVDSTRVRDGSVLLAEPKSNLSLGRLDRVGAMADVAADVNAEVAADRARSRGERVRSTEKSTGPDAMYLIRPGKKGLPLRSL